MAQGRATPTPDQGCLSAAPRPGLDRRAPCPASRGTHLYVLGLLPGSLGSQFGVADRSPVAERGARSAPGRRQRGPVGAGRAETQRSCADLGAAVGYARRMTVQRTIRPVDGHVYAERELASASQIEGALEHAVRAFGRWRAVPVPERAAVLARFCTALVRARCAREFSVSSVTAAIRSSASTEASACSPRMATASS